MKSFSDIEKRRRPSSEVLSSAKSSSSSSEDDIDIGINPSDLRRAAIFVVGDNFTRFISASLSVAEEDDGATE